MYVSSSPSPHDLLMCLSLPLSGSSGLLSHLGLIVMSGFAVGAPVFVPGKGLVRPESPAINGAGPNGGSPVSDVADNIPHEVIAQLQGK